jgi:hypothetical protein
MIGREFMAFMEAASMALERCLLWLFLGRSCSVIYLLSPVPDGPAGGFLYN